MKPKKLAESLDSFGAQKAALDAERRRQDQAIVDEKLARVRLARESIRATEKSGELSDRELAVAYAQTITGNLHYGGDQNADSTPDIRLDNDSQWDAVNFGKGRVVARLTAHTKDKDTIRKVRPYAGGPVSGYSIVIGFIPDESQPDNGFSQTDEQIRLRASMTTQYDAPLGTKVLLDVQKIEMTDGGWVVSDDFLDWARILLDEACNPDSMPGLYDADNLKRQAWDDEHPIVASQ